MANNTGTNYGFYYNILSISEIKMFTKSDPLTNIAPLFAKCYSFPITDKNIFYWYMVIQKMVVHSIKDDDITTKHKMVHMMIHYIVQINYVMIFVF